MAGKTKLPRRGTGAALQYRSACWLNGSTNSRKHIVRQPGGGTVNAADVAGKHAEIARRYAWQARARGKPGIPVLRIREIERLAQSRYGNVLPDNDAGRAFVRVAANHLSAFVEPELRIIGWLTRWAPWWTGDTRPRFKRWRADPLARLLNVTAEERWRLHLWTIGAINCSKADRERLGRQKAMVRERDRRAAKKRSACAV